MKFKKTKAAALTLAAVIACGTLAGCDLVTTDLQKDLAQVVATVNISSGKDFAEGGDYHKYADTIKTAEVLKRDIVADFANYGSTYISYGYSQEYVYGLIINSQVNRQIYLQYARVYYFENTDKNAADYNKAISDAETKAKADGKSDAIVRLEGEIAGVKYFLDEDEVGLAEYSVKAMFNNTLDSQELSFIDTPVDEHNHDTARTTPTGVSAVNEDYYDVNYAIYTGWNNASYCGTYEAQDGSTPTTRKTAYKTLLSNLNTYGLVSTGENTSDIMSLTYYYVELKSQLESTLVNKLTEEFEKYAEEKFTKEWIGDGKYSETLANQQRRFNASTAEVESALDSVSDSSYVFYAPDDYGFVINILLPFNALQTQQLTDSAADFGDKQGNKFAKRASLLKGLTATDQRNTWFTGHDDYSFVAGEDDKAFGGAGREYLFFEDNVKKSSGNNAQYEIIKNYYGAYTYNGAVFTEKDDDGDTTYTFKPNKLTIDDFLTELEEYLKFAGYNLENKEYPNGNPTGEANYYNRPVTAYYKNGDVLGDVDYESFLYFQANVAELAGEKFNANYVFRAGEKENEVMSIINELSFAYNTDTAGLNSYLGYAVTPNNTNFVKEFEYAAQMAVKGGAGTITVAPSEYGWHIMYCTFSYATKRIPYTFNYDEITEEGTFSNLYYEALKASNLSSYSSDRRTTIINTYDNDDCVTRYEKRYQDLLES